MEATRRRGLVGRDHWRFYTLLSFRGLDMPEGMPLDGSVTYACED